MRGKGLLIGFDFVAVESYSDPVYGHSLLRLSGGDIPLEDSPQGGLRVRVHLPK